MVNSFEVASTFRIIDAASPVLAKILKQVRELGLAIDKARTNLASLGTGSIAGLSTATGETQALANAWKEVATASAAATRNMATAGAASRRASAAGVAAAGGRGGRGWGGGGGHFGSTSIPIPGGSHFRMSGNAAMAGAGLLGYGVYQEMEMQDAVVQLLYHTGQSESGANQKKFRDIIQGAHSKTGKPLNEVIEAAKDYTRQMVGTPGGGLDSLPDMMKYAGTESILKGSGLKESMSSFVSLAHMVQAYSPEQMKKLAPDFAFLSSANPDKLGGIERALSYSLPILNSGLGVNPTDTILAGTVMRRAGATSSKSGTWLRSLIQRSQGGSEMYDNPKKFAEHERLMKAAGLQDASGHQTNLGPDGHVSIMKTLEALQNSLPKLQDKDKNAVMNHLFGERGSGAAALLTTPGALNQMKELKEMLADPERRKRAETFLDHYNETSPLQQMRTTFADFQNVMMDLGKTVLPAVVNVMKDVDGVLNAIKKILPGGDKPDDKDANGVDKWKVGTRALEGGLAGGIIGAPFGMAIPGAGIGAIGGGIAGIVEGITKVDGGAKMAVPAVDDLGRVISSTGKDASSAAGGMGSLGAAIRGLLGAMGAASSGGLTPGNINNVIKGSGGGKSAGSTTASLHIRNGTKLADALIEDHVNNIGPLQGSYPYDHTRGIGDNDFVRIG
jgi:TP901 family phage tail tape measure protein